MLNSLTTTGGGTPESPGFSRRARGQLFAKAHYASPVHKAGSPTHRNLSQSQFLEACHYIDNWAKDDDWRAAYAVCAALSSLTIDLVPKLPLRGELDADWVVSLDVSAGALVSDLSFLAPEAAAAPQYDTVLPAELVASKPLPAHIAARVRDRQKRFPDARVLHELYPEAALMQGHMTMFASRQEITPSWAKWCNSLGIYARRMGLDNFLVAILTNDFGHVPRSKLYYARVEKIEIWSAAEKLFQLCGWGSAEPCTGHGVAFGSRVVPSEEAIKRAQGWHRAEARAMHPARSDRSTQKLFEFHNRYTRCVAFELALMLGLREREAYDLWADIDEEVDLWVELLDKVVPGPTGALPVPLCGRARKLIYAYRSHCRATAERVCRFGGRATVFHEWLTKFVDGERVPLLCAASGLGSTRSVGSGEAFGGLPAHLRLAPDAGRKWLENGLRREGLRTGDIDAVLRHDVIGQSRFCSTSDFNLLEWALRAGAAVDRMANVVLGPVQSGLARR
jgi:hypothetical protein